MVLLSLIMPALAASDTGPAWQTRLTGGAGPTVVLAGTGGGAGLGAELGLITWRTSEIGISPRLRTGVSFDGLLLPGGASGEEARGGVRLGPHGRTLGLDVGVELASSRLELPGRSLPSSVGLSLPVAVSARAGAVELALEVERLWLAEPRRRGAGGWRGDEQVLSVGLGHRPRATILSLRYRLHRSGQGDVHGLAVRVGA